MDTSVDIFNEIAIRIIQEQEAIIGPLAWSEAEKVPSLHITNPNKGEEEVHVVDPDPRKTINELVERYEKLFGRLSRDVSREATSDLTADIPAEDVPTCLK